MSRQNYHLTQPCQSEEKQTNKHSAQISPYMKLTNHWTKFRKAGKKGRKNSPFPRKEFNFPCSLGKGDLKHNNLKKKKKKRQRNTAHMKKKITNTEA